MYVCTIFVRRSVIQHSYLRPNPQLKARHVE